MNSWRFLRFLLFKLEPERAHDLILALLAGWSKFSKGRVAAADPARAPNLAVKCMGLNFPNPIGLAAGLDKNAQALPIWQKLGFGFIEVGTVTPLPQAGNPRPRLFRLPAEQALINRMGFNNLGVAVMRKRLEKIRARNLLEVPLGVNIGRAKDTPAPQSADDYQQVVESLGELADYFVLNLSSPNTPGLRSLQQAVDIERILAAVQKPNQCFTNPRPILIKLAPDLPNEEILECAQAVMQNGGAGLILTNTTTRFDGLRDPTAVPVGGLSGQPLFERSTEVLRFIRAELGSQPVLIGVGGILDPAGAASKLNAGANLIQIYTGLVYHGPQFVRSLFGLL